jgi:hypothetical protein
METIADPASDREGIALSAQRERERARGSTPQELDSDF